MIVKICGLKTLQDSLIACQAGADMLGFNFYQASSRYITVENCCQIVTEIKAAYPAVICVGVFVNHSIDQVKQVMSLASLDLAQLSGDEPVEAFEPLGDIRFHALRALSMHEIHTIMNKMPPKKRPPAFLLDSDQKGSYGGSGKTGDWRLAADAAKHYPLLLAGGLNLDNVAEAINTVRPWGVDVASGVESQPGVKDTKKIAVFISEAKRIYRSAQS